MSERKTREMFEVHRENSLPMLLQTYKLILIVEGCSDKKFCSCFSFPDVHIEPAGNKIKARKMIHAVLESDKNVLKANKKKGRRIRALVDRDYDFLTDHQSNNEQLIYTDANCLETMIWMTDDNTVLRSIVSQLVEMDTMEDVPLSAIYERTYQAATLLGLVRLADSLHKAWNLDLKPFSLQRDMLDEQDMLLLEPVVDAILDSGTTKVQCTREDLIQEVNRLQQENIDQWQLMQGHDLSEAFVFHIKKNCKFYPEDWPGWDDLKDAVRDFESKAQLAVNKAGMRETECFRQISNWIKENA